MSVKDTAGLGQNTGVNSPQPSDLPPVHSLDDRELKKRLIAKLRWLKIAFGVTVILCGVMIVWIINNFKTTEWPFIIASAVIVGIISVFRRRKSH